MTDVERRPPAPRYRRESPDDRREMLIAAATRCLAEDGIRGFTIGRICKQAGVSRGLINHYFETKDDLLVEIYRGSLYRVVSARLARIDARAQAGGSAPEERLAEMVEATFTPAFFSRANLRVWLALWGEIAVNEALRRVHRELYDAYRSAIAREVALIATARGCDVDAAALARSFLALVDGLWLEWCLDDAVASPADARRACIAMLEAHLGPLSDS